MPRDVYNVRVIYVPAMPHVGPRFEIEWGIRSKHFVKLKRVINRKAYVKLGMTIIIIYSNIHFNQSLPLSALIFPLDLASPIRGRLGLIAGVSSS